VTHPADGPEQSVNQPHPADPEDVPPSPAHGDSPAATTDDADRQTQIGTPLPGRVEEQVGAPERAVPDVPPAHGTSEELPAVAGVHTPDVGPGGEQFDTAEHPSPGRNRPR
jgi:hypothetical protein